MDQEPAYEPTHPVQRGGLHDLREDRSLVTGVSAERLPVAAGQAGNPKGFVKLRLFRCNGWQQDFVRFYKGRSSFLSRPMRNSRVLAR